jgi:acetyltransferase-like isoleucine patch superfamily enzyme
MFSVARLLRFAAVWHAIKNSILNALAMLVSGQRVYVDWRDLKIVNPNKIYIGNGFSCGRSLWLESVDGVGIIDIGAHVNLSDYVHIAAFNHVKIGDGVLVGSRVLITDHSHGHSPASLAFDFSVAPNCRQVVSKGAVKIGDRVWLGDGVCILSGVTIGEASIVGANSVVLNNIPSNTVWAGVPAKQVWP